VEEEQIMKMCERLAREWRWSRDVTAREREADISARE
jgi:hypothetical protein